MPFNLYKNPSKRGLEKRVTINYGNKFVFHCHYKQSIKWRKNNNVNNDYHSSNKSEEDFVRMHGQKEEQRQHHSAINPSLILSHFPHKQVW